MQPIIGNAMSQVLNTVHHEMTFVLLEAYSMIPQALQDFLQVAKMLLRCGPCNEDIINIAHYMFHTLENGVHGFLEHSRSRCDSKWKSPVSVQTPMCVDCHKLAGILVQFNLVIGVRKV